LANIAKPLFNMFAFVWDIYFSAVRMQNLQQIENFTEAKNVTNFMNF